MAVCCYEYICVCIYISKSSTPRPVALLLKAPVWSDSQHKSSQSSRCPLEKPLKLFIFLTAHSGCEGWRSTLLRAPCSQHFIKQDTGQVGPCTAGRPGSSQGYCLPLTLANAWIKAASYSAPVAYWISDRPSAAQIKVWAAWPFTCRAVEVPPVKWASLALLHWSISHEERAFHRAWSPFNGAEDLRACLSGKPSHPGHAFGMWKRSQQEWPGSGPAASGTPRFKLKWKKLGWCFTKTKFSSASQSCCRWENPCAVCSCHLHLQPWVVPISKFFLTENQIEEDFWIWKPW